MDQESHPSLRPDLREMTPEELSVFVTESLGEKPYRARQIYQWLHEKGVENFDQMTTLSLNLRRKLSESASLSALSIEQRQISREDQTRKYLFSLSDGNMIESVFLPYHHGNSVCISSQVGCRMGCAFCASTIGGKVRNLTAAEMLGQIYGIRKDTGEKISNVVVMGTGEPLDNYDELLRFLHILTGEGGMHLSQRSVTVSTCGLVPEIGRLAEEHLQITLAISLHAPNQEKRERLMPIAKKYDIHQVVEAAEAYFKETGRRISFEYSLIAGFNDSRRDAAMLSGLLSGFPCHVNLIPVNPVRERSFTASSRKTAEAFAEVLSDHNITATIRRHMGRDIDGACGQLRRKHLDL